MKKNIYYPCHPKQLLVNQMFLCFALVQFADITFQNEANKFFHSVSSLSFLWNDIFELTFCVVDMGSVNGFFYTHSLDRPDNSSFLKARSGVACQ